MSITPEPQPDQMTTLILAVGGVQADVKTAISGIGEVKSSVDSHGVRIGAVERVVAVHDVRLKDHDDKFNDAKPQKGRWPNIISAAAAAFSVGFFILDRLYAGH